MFMGMSIGQLGKATGTAVETVRYYEKIGLLPPAARTAGNYRSYGSSELGRLTFIRRARNLGFAIEQVRALLKSRRRAAAAVRRGGRAGALPARTG